jgi:MFS family permease
MAAGWMHTGYYVGFFLAALANYQIGARYGWRWMFAIGGLPALMVSFIRYGVKEPTVWENKAQEVRTGSVFRPLASLFRPEFRKRTIVNSLYVLVSIIGLWAGSVYVPAAITEIVNRNKIPGVNVTHLISLATMLLSVATILGCVLLPILAERIGRRVTLGLYYVCMLLAIGIGFGYVFYLPVDPLKWFIVCLFFLGLGGANFAMYTLWLPEQYPTECRGSAFAFTTSVGRFAGAGFTFLVGAGVAHYHTIGKPVAIIRLGNPWRLRRWRLWLEYCCCRLGMRRRVRFCPPENRRGPRQLGPYKQNQNKNYASSSTRASPWRALCAAITLSASSFGT